MGIGTGKASVPSQENEILTPHSTLKDTLNCDVKLVNCYRSLSAGRQMGIPSARYPNRGDRYLSKTSHIYGHNFCISPQTADQVLAAYKPSPISPIRKTLGEIAIVSWPWRAAVLLDKAQQQLC